jgi:hypothetical protein
MYGASRPTFDVDCLPRRTEANLDNLAAAMRELGARIRSEGLTDDEAKKLPTQIDRVTLASMEISTWTTTPATSTCSLTCQTVKGDTLGTTTWWPDRS